MTPYTTEDLAALIGSRICHDLISPIGAISNGLELLALSGIPDSPELSLINDSASSANARIRLFRLAFGMASEGQMTSAEEIRRAWAGAYPGDRLLLELHAPDQMLRLEAQALLLACLCAEAALPQGGRLTAERSESGSRLTATGTTISVDPGLWACLGGEDRDVSPAQVQFVLLPRLLAQSGRGVSFDAQDQTLTVTF